MAKKDPYYVMYPKVSESLEDSIASSLKIAFIPDKPITRYDRDISASKGNYLDFNDKYKAVAEIEKDCDVVIDGAPGEKLVTSRVIIEVRGKRIALMKYDSADKDDRTLVATDFEWAESKGTDIRIVVVDFGFNSSHEITDEYVDLFNHFRSSGADIIVGKGSGKVRQAKFEQGTLYFFGLGNMSSSELENDSGLGIVAKVYLSMETNKPIAASVTPIISYGRNGGVVASITLKDAFLKGDSLSNLEMDYLRTAHDKILKSVYPDVTFGDDLNIEQLHTEYYLLRSNGYARGRVDAVDINERGDLYNAINESQSICFIGDSVTEGTENGGYPWYEPLMQNFPEKEVVNISKGGWTSKCISRCMDDIRNCGADIYVIAIGCNDIRYRDVELCAMDAESFCSTLNDVCNKIKRVNSGARFAFVAPWHSDDEYDEFRNTTAEIKNILYKQYIAELKKMCRAGGYVFSDPNPMILEEFSKGDIHRWIKDWIHPNAYYGIRLYSKAAASYKE